MIRPLWISSSRSTSFTKSAISNRSGTAHASEAVPLPLGRRPGRLRIPLEPHVRGRLAGPCGSDDTTNFKREPQASGAAAEAVSWAGAGAGAEVALALLAFRLASISASLFSRILIADSFCSAGGVVFGVLLVEFSLVGSSFSGVMGFRLIRWCQGLCKAFSNFLIQARVYRIIGKHFVLPSHILKYLPPKRFGVQSK